MAKQQLPHDLVFYDILPRLPTKSVGRFRCVSKAWYSFLKKAEFALIHLNDHVSKNRSQKLLVISYNYTEELKLNTFDSEAKPDGRNHILSLVSGFVISVSALGSCNGLVCMALWHGGAGNPVSMDIVVCNPLTGEYKKFYSMPSPLTPDHEDFRAFYYDKGVKDYKILDVSCGGKVCIYSLKANSWRDVGDISYEGYFCHYRSQPRVFVNGSIYWIAKVMSNNKLKLLSFDLNNENLKVMPFPQYFDWLINHQERLHAVSVNCEFGNIGVQLWRMNNNENKKEAWEKTGTRIFVSYSKFFVSYGKHIFMLERDKSKKHSKLIAYNLENQNMDSKFETDKYEYIGDVIVYKETLISPNDIC